MNANRVFSFDNNPFQIIFTTTRLLLIGFVPKSDALFNSFIPVQNEPLCSFFLEK